MPPIDKPWNIILSNIAPNPKNQGQISGSKKTANLLHLRRRRPIQARVDSINLDAFNKALCASRLGRYSTPRKGVRLLWSVGFAPLSGLSGFRSCRAELLNRCRVLYPVGPCRGRTSVGARQPCRGKWAVGCLYGLSGSGCCRAGVL